MESRFKMKFENGDEYTCLLTTAYKEQAQNQEQTVVPEYLGLGLMVIIVLIVMTALICCVAILIADTISSAVISCQTIRRATDNQQVSQVSADFYQRSKARFACGLFLILAIVVCCISILCYATIPTAEAKTVEASIGVGLGLPGHMPGMADKNILTEGVRQSEDYHIEPTMLEDKLRATDWEATNEAIEEQVARESYLQWLKDNERRNRRSPVASSSTATVTSASSTDIRSPRPRSHGGMGSPLGSLFRGERSFKNSPARLSPPHSVPGTSKTVATVQSAPATVSSKTLEIELTKGSSESPEDTFEPPEMFGLNEWDDAGLLAASQQEYLDDTAASSPPPKEKQ